MGLPAIVLGSCLSVVGIAGVPNVLGFWQAAKRRQPAAVDFQRPARTYENAKLVDARYGEFTVSVEKQLKATRPRLPKGAARLKAKRAEALAAVPKPAVTGWRRSVSFCCTGRRPEMAARTTGLSISRRMPENHDELDPRWGDAIVIYCARTIWTSQTLGAQGALP